MPTLIAIGTVTVALALGCGPSYTSLDPEIQNAETVVEGDSVALSAERVGDDLEIRFQNLGDDRRIVYAGGCLATIVAARGSRVLWDQRQVTRFCTDDGAEPFVERGDVWTVSQRLPEEVLSLDQEDLTLYALIRLPTRRDPWLLVR